MVQVEKLAEKLFSLLKGYGFKIKIFDEVGNETTDPEAGRRFFVADPNFMITIDTEDNNIEFNKGASVDFEQARTLQQRLRKIADSFLVNSTIKVFGKSIQPRDFSYKAKMMKEAALQEGLSKMSGSKKTSHQTLETVKLIIRHKTPVNEESRGSRSRNISAIFLEHNGERFRFPSNHLAGARAMAQHMAHSGTMHDKVGSYIIENTAWLTKLQNFTRYATVNKLINEDSAAIVDTVVENIKSIKAELKKLTGTRTYETVSARIASFERDVLAEDDVSTLKDMFTIRRFDEKFSEVLPIINQLVLEKDTYNKRIEEAANNLIQLKKGNASVPMFEFASKNAEFGYKLNELSLRIVENDELATFVGNISNKLCKNGDVSVFERAIIKSVLENAKTVSDIENSVSELTESVKLEQFYDRYELRMLGIK